MLYDCCIFTMNWYVIWKIIYIPLQIHEIYTFYFKASYVSAVCIFD